MIREKKKNKKLKQTTKKDFQVNAKTQQDKIEREKTLTMWSGVIFFMVLILFVWIVNLKHSFKNIETTNKISGQLNWNEITDNFSKTINQVEEKLNEAKKNTNNTENQEYKNSTTTQNNIIDNSVKEQSKGIATSTTVVGKNNVLMLKKKLESL